jgi:virginiamycin A acetyltransferase
MSIEAHPTARISPLADIEESVRGTRFAIGARSMIDSFVKLKPVGGSGEIVIGEDCYINSGCVFYSGNGITLGNQVSMAAGCVLAPVNHEYADPDRPIQAQGFRPSKGGIVIEDDVWLGAGCVILDGAHIGKGAVIGAMSLVRGEIAAYTIASGNPLQVHGSRR